MTMNTTAITGTLATEPRHDIRGYVPTTTFDVRVVFARRVYTFHVRAMNDLAERTRHLRPADPVAITGYLHAEPHDTPDCGVWQRVEIVAYEVDGNPIDTTDRLVEMLQ